MGRRAALSMTRSTNAALLVGLIAAWATGTLAFATGAGWTRPVALAHAAAGFVLVVLVPGKTPIVRRGLRRRSASRTCPSVVLAVLVVAALLTGAAHSAGARVRVAGVDALWLHVAVALAAGPLVGWHLVTRPIAWRRVLRRPLAPQSSPGTTPAPTPGPTLDRRELLRGSALLTAAAAGTAAWEAAIRLAGWRGATRRGTGSYPRGSHDPARMPVTMWLDDDLPADTGAEGWTVALTDADGTRHVPASSLAVGAERVTATVDCTGGWYAEQQWRGARLDSLLRPSPRHAAVEVRSVTGYARRLPVRDLRHLWLASGYVGSDGGDVALRPGHGAPVRLVAPGRRGFWWVKWVDAVILDERPWWWQPPFPLT